jgi:hypothetical protein
MHTRKLAVLALAGALAVGAFGLPFLASRQREKQRRLCLEHLRQVNQPLNCCIPLENKLKPGDSFDPKLIFDYLKHGVVPHCPAGAEYAIPFVAGGRPVCPIHGDLLAGATNVEVLGPNPIYPAGFRHE